jgi:hypothetical protein
MLDWLPDYRWLFGRIAEWLLDQHWLVDHIPEWLIALFTGTLWWSTRRLWIATRNTLRHTQGTTEVLQHVQPGGIGTTTKGHILAHVNFKNVGHLPASDFKWTVQELIPSDQDDWKPPPISDSGLRPSGVLPIDTTFKRGSKALEGVPSNEFIYVWGRVTYLDGFGKRRFTNFCHRYNTAVKKTPVGGGYVIREEDARYHDYGNEAD